MWIADCCLAFVVVVCWLSVALCVVLVVRCLLCDVLLIVVCYVTYVCVARCMLLMCVC